MTGDAIEQLIRDSGSGDFDAHFDARFDTLALALLRRQARQGILRTDAASKDLEECDSWQAAHPRPADLIATGVGLQSDDGLLAAVREAEWRQIIAPPAAPVLLLEDPDDPSTTALLAPRSEPNVTAAKRSQRLDALTIRSWLGSRQRAGAPVWIVGNLGSAERLLANLDQRRLRFRLPAGSRLVMQCAYDELFDELGERAERSSLALGIHPQGIRYLLHQPTLASRIAVDQKEDGRLELTAPAPWVRYRITSSRSSEARLVVMDLATTAFPACQQLDWRVTAGTGTSFRLALPST